MLTLMLAKGRLDVVPAVGADGRSAARLVHEGSARPWRRANPGNIKTVGPARRRLSHLTSCPRHRPTHFRDRLEG